MTPNIIRDDIRALSSYPVAKAEGYIKLDAMENPYPFPPHLQAGLALALSQAALNRYPDAAGDALKTELRHAMRIPDGLDILLGNGSDEIIQLIALASAKPGAALLSVEPAFVMFKMIATFCGLRYVGVPLRPDFSLDTDAMLAAVRNEQPAVTFIAYPNNPTGNLFDRASIQAIILATQAYGGLVVIDEAYFAFSSASFMDEVATHPNVVLMRTVSKLGLAGLRLGLLVGRREWLNEFDKLRLPYNINCLTQAAARFALQHLDALLAQTEHLKQERTRVAAALDKMVGITRFPSEANFILIRVPNASAVFQTLLSKKILVKNTSTAHPLLSNTLRLTIGTPDENNALLNALQP